MTITHVDPATLEYIAVRIFWFIFPIIAVIFHILLVLSVYYNTKKNVESNEDI